MKKSLLALAALTAFAGVASAQSSVTLFGVVDVNMRAVDNSSAGTIYSLSTGGMNTSRLGFRGIEDLGGGLRAGFWLEGGISPDTGQGASTDVSGNPFVFQRRATISLIGNFGEIRLGRDEHATYKIGGYEYFNTNGVATGFNLYSNLGSNVDLVRNSNMVGYFLPAMGGLFGQIQVAAGEGTAANSTTARPTKYFGGIVGYAAGPFRAAVSYGQWEKDGAMLDDFTVFNAALEWKFGAFKVLGIYQKSEYSDRDQDIFSIPVSFTMGASEFKAQYTTADGSTDRYSADSFGVGYVYSMSKRTALYAHWGQISNTGAATKVRGSCVGVPQTSGSTFTTTGSGPAGICGGENSSGYEFGVRHFF